MSLEITPYLSRLVLQWDDTAPGKNFREIPGTLVFVDLSGFTSMSERLARLGKMGAEEVVDVINATFAELLSHAYRLGGSLIQFGGDALLLFFEGEEHVERGCRAAAEMRKRLRTIGRIKTSAGLVTLKMSVGIHTGTFHFFLVGESHRELVITGPGATQTVMMESCADAGEILVSQQVAAVLPRNILGDAKDGGVLLKRAPKVSVPLVEPQSPPSRDDAGSFLSTAIRTYLDRGGQDAEHRQVTISFIKFTGMNELIAGEGSAVAGERLHLLITAAQAACDEFGITFLGTDIDKDGGKLFLAGGAPRSTGNDEERVLRAVRAIADADQPFDLKIGVNRGRGFAGAVGPYYRKTYTAMGDVTNTAARVMSKAAPGQVLATQQVLERSNALFETEPIEPFAAKGKKHPIVAFAVGKLVSTRAASTQASLPMVGRDQEWKTLASAWDEAARGRGNLVEIIGEAGVGKSRLVQELDEYSVGARRIAVSCQQYESSTPYFAMRALLEPLVGLDTISDPADRASGLLSAVRRVAPELEPWIPLLALPFDIEVPSTVEVEQLDAGVKKSKLHEVVLTFVQRNLSEPTVIVFEDAHWMDEESSSLVSYIVSRDLTGTHWLICVTKRYADSGFVPPEDVPTRSIALSPLSAEASGSLARAASARPLPKHAMDAMVERSGGNPFFLQELVEAYQPQASLDSLPESLEAVVSSRIDRLDPSDRSLIRDASVLGMTFDDELLTQTSEQVPDETSWLRLSGFIERDGQGQFHFRHALYRDVAYEALPYRKRKELHTRAGESLEASHDNREEVVELLSLHFLLAQQFEKAWRYSLVAGIRAEAKFANIDAATFFTRAIEAGKRAGNDPSVVLAPVWAELGMVSEMAGLYKQADVAFVSARRLSPEDVWRRGDMLRKQGEIAFRLGNLHKALRLWREGLKILKNQEMTKPLAMLAVRFMVGTAYLKHSLGHSDLAIPIAKEAIDVARMFGDEPGSAQAHTLLFVIFMELGSDERVKYRDVPLPIFEKVGDLRNQSWFLINLGEEAYYEGRWDDAVDFYRRSKAICEKSGNVVLQARSTLQIGQILSDQGHLDEAERSLRECLVTLEAAEDKDGIAMTLSNLGRLYSRSGRFQDAYDSFATALSILNDVEIEGSILLTQARVAETALENHDVSKALDVLSILTEDRLKDASLQTRAMVKRLQGIAMVKSGKLEDGGTLFEESLADATKAGAMYELALTLKKRAELADLLCIDPKGDLLEADRIFEGLGVVQRIDITRPDAVPVT